MDKEYYKKYYDYERNHWWFKVREKIIIEKIDKLTKGRNDLKILNVGVATGRTTEVLRKFGEVVSVEYDEDCCEFLRTHLHMPVINGSITELPFEINSFDLVCAFDVIEHVEDDKTAVNEMIRVCKNDGSIIITVPAYMSLWSNHDIINHHKRRYVLPELKLLLVNQPIKHAHSTYFNTFLFIPIYLTRKTLNLLSPGNKKPPKETDFELFENNFINNFLFMIFSMERTLLRIMRFPFGVSILLTFNKTENWKSS